MSSLFTRIYLGLIAAMLLLSGAVLLANSLVEDARSMRYRQAAVVVPMQLIAQGIARHSGDERQRWIEIVSRLLNAELRIERSDSPAEVLRIEPMGEQQYRARLALPGARGQEVVLQFQHWNEQQWRATTFLILNEIGRQEPERQRAALLDLASELPYPLLHLRLDDSELDARQRERIEAGEVVMLTEWRDGGRPSTRFFAPYGQRGDLLALGPVPSHGALPLSFSLPLLGGAAVSFALVALWLVRLLERRLQTVEDALTRVGHAEIRPGELGPPSGDALGRLARSVETMSARIRGLLQAQNEMVQGVSHDLRTPVARIRLRLELLGAQGHGEQQRIDGIRRDLDDIEAMVDAAISYTRLDASGAALRREPLDLAALLHRLASDLSAETTPAIELQIDDGAPVIEADRSLLQRALQNLLTNAQRHARSRVLLTLASSEQWLGLRVDDDGPGVAEELRQHIFEPFSRLDSTRSKRSGGYGLGLAIARRVAERHGGRILCESAPALGGARFELQLPCPRTAPPAQQKSNEVPTAAACTTPPQPVQAALPMRNRLPTLLCLALLVILLPASVTRAQPGPSQRGEAAAERKAEGEEDWGVWNEPARRSGDPLLNSTARRRAALPRALDPANRGELLPVGIAGRDELLLNALDRSEIKDPPPPPPPDGGP